MLNRSEDTCSFPLSRNFRICEIFLIVVGRLFALSEGYLHLVVCLNYTKMCPLDLDSNSNIMIQNPMRFLVLFPPTLPFCFAQTGLSYFTYTYFLWYFCFQSLFPEFYLMLSFPVVLTNINHSHIDKTPQLWKVLFRLQKNSLSWHLSIKFLPQSLYDGIPKTAELWYLKGIESSLEWSPILSRSCTITNTDL